MTHARSFFHSSTFINRTVAVVDIKASDLHILKPARAPVVQDLRSQGRSAGSVLPLARSCRCAHKPASPRSFSASPPYFRRTDPRKTAITTAVITVTKPGSMKLWLTSSFPIFVVPVWSNEIAASKVPYVGTKKTLFAVG